MTLHSAHQLILRAIAIDLQVIRHTIPLQTSHIQFRNIGKSTTHKALPLLLLLFHSTQQRALQQIDGLLPRIDADDRGRVWGCSFNNLESVTLNANDGTIIELDFVPAAQGLRSTDDARATDEVPLCAVVARDLNDGATREHGVTVGMGTRAWFVRGGVLSGGVVVVVVGGGSWGGVWGG